MNPEYLPMNNSEVLDRVFEVYKRSFAKQLLYSLVVGAIASAGGVLLLVFGSVLAFAVFTIETSFIVSIAIIVGVALIFFMAWTSATNAGFILLSKPAFYGKKVELPMKQLAHTIFRLASAIIAQALISVPFVIVFAVLFYFLFDTVLVSSILDTFVLNHAFQVAGAFGTVLIIGLVIGFLYIIYSNFFFLVVSVAVFEKKIFFGSLGRAYELIKGDFWQILGLRTIWYLIITIISTSAAQMMLAFTTLAELFAANTSLVFIAMVMTIVFNILAFGISFLIAPLSGIMPAVIYFNQRIKKEGMGIEIQIERLKT